MGTYISIYSNDPTAAGTDGTQLSEDGAQTSPLAVTLDATAEESSIIKCAIRSESGYTTSGDTVLSFSGTNATKWSIAPDDSYADAAAAAAATYSSSLTITDAIDATNTIFWVKITSSSDETPQSDTSVTLNAAGTSAAA